MEAAAGKGKGKGKRGGGGGGGGKKLSPAKAKEELDKNHLLIKSASSPMFVLVLDEIDQLETADNNVLYTVFAWVRAWPGRWGFGARAPSAFYRWICPEVPRTAPLDVPLVLFAACADHVC